MQEIRCFKCGKLLAKEHNNDVSFEKNGHTIRVYAMKRISFHCNKCGYKFTKQFTPKTYQQKQPKGEK